MKQSILTFILSFIFNVISAHEPNVAYFLINTAENTIEVKAEFPWTIRNALIKYNNTLENATTKDAFSKAFYSYIKENFILFDKDENQLKLISVEELPQEGHSHGSSFLITYEGNTFWKVKNELMFNLYNKQQNHHKLATNKNLKEEYITTKNEPIFELSEKSRINLVWLGIAVLFVASIIIFFIKREFFFKNRSLK